MFSLSGLPYSMDALAPAMSAETLEFHYGKHHKAYVDKLNELIIGHRLFDVPDVSCEPHSLPEPPDGYRIAKVDTLFHLEKVRWPARLMSTCPAISRSS